MQELFLKHKVLNARELEARVSVLAYQYNTWREIEARTMVQMIRTQLLPSAERAQKCLAETVTATLATKVEWAHGETQFQEFVSMTDELIESVQVLDRHLHDFPSDEAAATATVVEHLIPAMDRARAAADALEAHISDEHWTLLRCTEMILLR